MPNLTKIIAITDATQWRWKVLIEIDSAALRALCSKFDGTPPTVGTEIDFDPMLDRLQDIEDRERKMRDFAALLSGFMPKPEPRPE